MRAVLGLHHAGIAGLAGRVEAPVVEGLHHLPRIHVLIESAGGLGAGVLGVLGRQGRKALLRGRAVRPLRQDLLRPGLGGGPIRVGQYRLTVLVGLRVLGSLGRDEDVADVDHVGVVLREALGRELIGVLVKIGVHLRLAAGDGPEDAAQIIVVGKADPGVIGVVLGGDVGAVHALDIGVAVLIASHLGGVLQALEHGVHVLLHRLARGKAVPGGGVADGAVLPEGGDGHAEEHILPGVGLVVHLLAHGLAQVQAQHGDIGAVGAHEAIELLPVVE